MQQAWNRQGIGGIEIMIMKYTLTGEFMDLNTYIDFERTNKMIAHQIKKNETNQAAIQLRGQSLSTDMQYRVSFIWYSRNKRKDIDNIAFAKKFIIDGFVKAGVLDTDSQKRIAGFGGEDFFVDKKNPRVEVTFEKFEPELTT